MTFANAKRYPSALKESMVRRYLSSDTSYRELAEEIGADASTVRGWVKAFRERGTVGRKRKKRARSTDARSAAEKLRLLFAAKAFDEDELGEFLRREGIHEGDLERWEQEALGGLSGAAQDTAKDRRIGQLERERDVQSKRLKEAKALLDLQKKVQALWADEDDDTTHS